MAQFLTATWKSSITRQTIIGSGSPFLVFVQQLRQQKSMVLHAICATLKSDSQAFSLKGIVAANVAAEV